ncbi:recombinase family protein [Novosphingobium sp. MW5]|nr:recombinase family protein [Novosphingobium sp. MW5]
MKRCAIYTRKSSDEGLEQEFNSLDAQREAGEAYVKSQASEGWRASATRYDDGGFSGGTMERPGLRRLLADIDSGLIDVVVVYKIDRLTRSLADFARIVEQFDANEVSFVSVTQAFNTTSSMGRLTLNVLLSFAQFEREVTGERIRDKIAASKAKGMWMGGTLPLGYDAPLPGTHVLRVNETEAATVRCMFTRYLELGSVHRLVEVLQDQGIVSKRRVTVAGKELGGLPFSRGALFHLLRNRTYLGKITHGALVHEGQHEAIIDEDLFAAVQTRLDLQKRRHGNKAESRVAKALLTGRLFDSADQPMTPSFSRGRSGRVYRYYVSAALQQGGGTTKDNTSRVSAVALEKILAQALGRLLPTSGHPFGQVNKVTLRHDRIELAIPSKFGREAVSQCLEGEEVVPLDRATSLLILPVTFSSRRGARTIASGARLDVQPDPVLIAALRKAHRMLECDGGGRPVLHASPTSGYERRLVRLAFLAPAIQADILAGRQPRHVNLEALIKADIPPGWDDQRTTLRWHG